MKTKTYEVPADLMPDFAKVVEEWDLPCSVMGVNDGEEIILEVDFEANEKDAIHQLTYLIDEYWEQEEEEN